MSERANKILYMVLSLLIAVLFWLYVDGQEGNKITQSYNDIPIEFIGEEDSLFNKGLMLEQGRDTTVDLRLSGPRTVISSLRREDIHLQVNLSSVSSSGWRQLNFTTIFPDNVNRSEITVESQSLYTVTVLISHLSTRTIPVKAVVEGEVPEPYIYRGEGLVIDPVELVISGKEEIIDQVQEARVVIDLTDQRNTIQREYEYQLLDKDGEVVDTEDIICSVKRVDVTAPILLVKELTLSVIVNEAPGAMMEDVDYTLLLPGTNDSVDSIMVAGPAASLEGKDDIVVGVGEYNLADYATDVALTLPINMPANCINLSGITQVVLSIHYKNTTTKLFTVTNIATRGCSEGQSASIITSALNVVLRGREEDLEQVTADNIRVVADLTDYNNDGTVTVPAVVYVDGFEQVGAAGTYTVTVKLTS